MKIAIAGCLGRMGQTLVEAISRRTDLTLAAVSVQTAAEEPKAKALLERYSLGNTIIALTADTLAGVADSIIDFTIPEYSLELASNAAAQNNVHIIGTTGFTAMQQSQLEGYARQARIVKSGNFSIGVNVMALAIEQTAKRLKADYDIEVVEMHHRHKIDAPSGTALLLAEAAANGRNVSLSDVRRHYGEGRIGAREEGTIGIVARRGGEIIGDHTVTFAGNNELLDFTHRAFNRSIYADGAFLAAQWAAKQPTGLYSMQDVLA